MRKYKIQPWLHNKNKKKTTNFKIKLKNYKINWMSKPNNKSDKKEKGLSKMKFTMTLKIK